MRAEEQSRLGQALDKEWGAAGLTIYPNMARYYQGVIEDHSH